MGMYDDLVVKVPLPDWPEGITQGEFQTKSLECMLDDYELREDGTLWHETYEIEDRSDPNAIGIHRLAGMMTRINQRWEQVTLTGEVRFHDYFAEENLFIDYSAYFVDGRLTELHRIKED